jgi:hypothetical protein
VSHEEATRRQRAYKVPRTQHYIGYRATSDWGSGTLLSPYAVGDVVDIPADCPAFTDGRISHSWSDCPEVNEKPGRYVVTTVFSIGEGDEWYFRVSPMRADGYTWDESSDRLQAIPDVCDYTAGWTLVESSDPERAGRTWPDASHIGSVFAHG